MNGKSPKIPWINRVTNEGVLRRMNMDRKLLEILKKRKTFYRGHILKHFLKIIIKRKVESKRDSGR